jgi:hypothetical protein
MAVMWAHTSATILTLCMMMSAIWLPVEKHKNNKTF